MKRGERYGPYAKTPRRLAAIRHYRQRGWLDAQIAEVLGMTRQAVSDLARRHNLPPGPLGRIGRAKGKRALRVVPIDAEIASRITAEKAAFWGAVSRSASDATNDNRGAA